MKYRRPPGRTIAEVVSLASIRSAAGGKSTADKNAASRSRCLPLNGERDASAWTHESDLAP